MTARLSATAYGALRELGDLLDPEEDKAARAVVFGLLREMERGGAMAARRAGRLRLRAHLRIDLTASQPIGFDGLTTLGLTTLGTSRSFNQSPRGADFGDVAHT